MRRAYIGRQVLSGQTLLTDHAVVVRDGDIEAVVPRETPGLREMDTEDWGSVLIAPGTVNAHTPSFQSLVRGVLDDLPFFRWRDEGIYRIAPRLGPDEIYAGALLTFGEMLRYGRHHRRGILLRPRRRQRQRRCGDPGGPRPRHPARARPRDV